jgi:hypothetical protein
MLRFVIIVKDLTILKTIVEWRIRMKEFLFTLEFDGRNTVKKTVTNMSSILIEAPSVREAVRMFASKEELKYSGITKLMNSNNYRVFFTKGSKMIGKGREYIYLVKEETGIEIDDLHLQYINE